MKLVFQYGHPDGSWLVTSAEGSIVDCLTVRVWEDADSWKVPLMPTDEQVVTASHKLEKSLREAFAITACFASAFRGLF